MKKIFIFSLLITLFLHTSAQQRNGQKDIQAPLIRLFDGMSAINEEAVKAEVTADFILLENGKIWNTDSLVHAINKYKGLDLKRVNKFDFLQTEQSGNTAWVSYYNTADLTFKGKQIVVKWLESAILVKQQGDWKIKLLHSTVLQPEKTPQKSQ